MLDKLYENIGGKIKFWAKWLFVIEAIGAVFSGLAMIVADLDMILFGLLAIILGPIAAYISTWVLYAFGELVESTMELRRHMVPEQKNEYKKEDSALNNLISSLKKENVKIKAYSCAFCGKKDVELKTYKTQSTLGMEDVEYLLCESCALKNGFIKQ